MMIYCSSQISHIQLKIISRFLRSIQILSTIKLSTSWSKIIETYDCSYNPIITKFKISKNNFSIRPASKNSSINKNYNSFNNFPKNKIKYKNYSQMSASLKMNFRITNLNIPI